MKIEEAIVYCLASSGRGMRTEQIADMINRQRLHLRKDGHENIFLPVGGHFFKIVVGVQFICIDY